MDYLSHPLIWYAFGGIGLFCVLNHFIKPEGILRKIMIVELILLIVYAIDVNNIRYLASFFFHKGIYDGFNTYQYPMYNVFRGLY